MALSEVIKGIFPVQVNQNDLEKDPVESAFGEDTELIGGELLEMKITQVF